MREGAYMRQPLLGISGSLRAAAATALWLSSKQVTVLQCCVSPVDAARRKMQQEEGDRGVERVFPEAGL